MFQALHARLNFVYNCDCEACSGSFALANNTTRFQSLLNSVETAFNRLQVSGRYHPDDLGTVPEYKAVIDQTAKVFRDAIAEGIKTDVPEVMRKALDEDVFLFSALKTHAQLFEASRLLTKPDGSIRSPYEFQQVVLAINENYNVNYLDAERQFAITASQQAANWQDVEKDGDRFNLQYRTALDERVRKTHAALEGITLPVNDSFWNDYYPPNGWRCRCVAIQVNRDKYEVSNSKQAVKAGKLATTQIGRNGKNKLAIFRFNPGKQKIVFPPNHPYTKIPGAQTAKQAAVKKTKTVPGNVIESVEDFNGFMADFAVRNPDYFARGFRKLHFENNPNNNGSTDRNGNIWMTRKRMQLSIDGVNAIRQGIPTTYDQEDAISTLHHEIWHNAHKLTYYKLTAKQRRYMELANEFVSRKTLPDFMQKIGGKLQNTDLVSDRPSTGYNSMVRNYDYLIQWTKSDPAIVLKEVQNHLIESSYTIQIEGLINGIQKGSEFSLTRPQIKSLVSLAEKSYHQYYPIELLQYEKLLVKKTR